MQSTNTVTVSPKFQIVIPKTIRKTMHLKAGEKIQVIQYDNRIELIPIVSIKKLKGFLKGINTSIERDQDRL